MSETIGIQGGPASYHEMAARQLHPGAELDYCETFEDVFTALRDRQIGSAIVAIANNRVQFIPEPFEELVHGKGDLSVVGETYLRVEHALLATNPVELDVIREVHSQAPAIEQCRSFLEHHLPHARIIEEHDTAGSAEMVSRWSTPSIAAIASTKAAERYGLSILCEGIQDDETNLTRFLELKVVNGHIVPDADKTTMLLKTPQVSGALVDALLPFKREGINLSNLQSRTVPNSAFEMDFFVEFEAGTQESRVQEVLQELAATGHKYTVLGSYRKAEIPVDEV